MDDLSLVFRDNDELFTTSLVIAEQTETQHKNVLELIRDNLDDLNEVGNSAFETRNQEGAGRPTEYACLDEPAATLLITYMRNNEVVRAFKKRLVADFYTMRKMLVEQQIRSLTPLEYARRLLAAEEQAEATRMELQAEQIAHKETERALDEATPLAEVALNYFDDTTSAGRDYSVGEIAALLDRDPGIANTVIIGRTKGMGEGRLWKWLEKERWIFTQGRGYERHWQAMQTQKTARRMAMKLDTEQWWDDKARLWRAGNPQVRITVKGFYEIHKRMRGTVPPQTLLDQFGPD